MLKAILATVYLATYLNLKNSSSKYYCQFHFTREETKTSIKLIARVERKSPECRERERDKLTPDFALFTFSARDQQTAAC